MDKPVLGYAGLTTPGPPRINHAMRSGMSMTAVGWACVAVGRIGEQVESGHMVSWVIYTVAVLPALFGLGMGLAGVATGPRRGRAMAVWIGTVVGWWLVLRFHFGP